jgi:hypothetical protein
MQVNDFVDQRGAGVEYHRHQGGGAAGSELRVVSL